MHSFYNDNLLWQILGGATQRITFYIFFTFKLCFYYYLIPCESTLEAILAYKCYLNYTEISSSSQNQFHSVDTIFLRLHLYSWLAVGGWGVILFCRTKF